jgi:glycosyltransferase involved in cell wall biosynthesis
VVVSDVLRDGLMARGLEPGRVLVQPNGVDPERYRPDVDGRPVRRRHGLEGRTVVGFVGTFGMWHGAPVLARAARRVLRDRPEARFLFVGDGRDRAECESILAGYGERVVFTGLVPQDQGPAHLAAMDILAAPHVDNPDGTRFFGSPTKLFEYMAMGRAIVASRLEQIGEVLADGRTAVMVPPGDEEALAAAIVELFDDPARRAALGVAARRRALERHTWDANVRGVVARLSERGLVRWN